MGPPRYDPRTTDRRKRKTSPSKLRQTRMEKENPQVMDKEFSPTPKKQTQENDLVDRLRIFPQVENLTKWDINRKRAICVDCNKKHAGPVCPCNWCGWVHPGMPCPGRPYTPTLNVPKEDIREEESKKPVSCWHCGQDDHYAWTCGDKYQRQTQTQPNMETEGLPTIHVKKSPSFSMIDQLMTKARKVPTTTDKTKVVHGHLIRPSKTQTEIQKTHPTLSYILSKRPQVKPVEMYVPKGSSTSTLVIRGTGHGSSSGTGGNLQLKEVQCLQKVQGLQVWEVLLGDNPHPLGLLEEEVEMMMVIMIIMVMKVMMKMKTQKRSQIVVKMKKGLHPQMMVQVEEEGHHHPPPDSWWRSSSRSTERTKRP